jgi:predicted CxxxxCH...CXXCH cytochrome family protein
MLKPDSCYMCERPAVSREHAPPKCFFPEAKDLEGFAGDLRRNLITVPSCDEHNSKRSTDDEYAMAVTVMYFDNNPVADTHFGTKVVRALRRSPAFTASVFHNPKPVRVGGQPSLAATVDIARYDTVMEHTCRAIYCHEFGEKLTTKLTLWTTNFLYPNLQPDEHLSAMGYTVRRLLRDTRRKGENPDVFWYQVFHNPSSLSAFRLQFYGGLSIYAFADHSGRFDGGSRLAGACT